MRRALVLAVVLATAAVPAAAQNTAPSPRPDLVITSFGLSSWGTACQPGQTLFTFSVGVKNQGNAAWSGPDRPVLFVADMHLPNPGEFATGIAIDPPIAPGQTRTIPVALSYYTGNPGHITTGAPHPFKVTVNADKKIAESNYANNDGPGPVTWNGMKVINVGAPEACLKPAKPAPVRAAPPAPTPTLVPIR